MHPTPKSRRPTAQPDHTRSVLAAGKYDAVFSIMKLKYNATAQTELLAIPGNSQLLANATELARSPHEVLRKTNQQQHGKQIRSNCYVQGQRQQCLILLSQHTC